MVLCRCYVHDVVLTIYVLVIMGVVAELRGVVFVLLSTMSALCVYASWW